MPSDLLGESLLLSLGFVEAEGAFVFDTITAKATKGTWELGLSTPDAQVPPVDHLEFPLKATDLVAFCHRCLLTEGDGERVRSAQRLLPKAILLRQTLRLASGSLWPGESPRAPEST